VQVTIDGGGDDGIVTSTWSLGSALEDGETVSPAAVTAGALAKYHPGYLGEAIIANSYE
jgi:hypothetical protein